MNELLLNKSPIWAGQNKQWRRQFDMPGVTYYLCRKQKFKSQIMRFFFYIKVRERNFGRPSTIWQSRTSSNKGPLEGSRQARRRLKPTKRNLSRFNRCSTGAFARTCAPSYVGEISGPAVQKLETLKHIFDRRATGAWNFEHLCEHKLSDPRFGSRCRGLLPKVFILKMINRTFLLILKGSRRDLI
jgi:hypothetical protein